MADIPNASIWAIAIAILVYAFQRLIALYLWGRPVFRAGFSGDGSVHLSIVRHVRKKKPGRYIWNFLISPEPMSYPTLFHRFAALFPDATIVNRPFLPNLLLNVMVTAGFFVSCWLLFSENPVILGVSLAVFLMAPGQWIFEGPAIAYLKLSERYLGRILSSAAYACIVLALFHGNSWLYLSAVAFTGLAMISAIFARQALISGLPLLALLFLKVEPLLVLIGGLALGLILSGDQFRDGMRHTLLTWKLYKSHTKKSDTVRAALSRFFRFPERRPESSWFRYSLRTLWQLWITEPGRALLMYPEILLLLVLSGMYGDAFWIRAFLPPLILYFLTSLDAFNHLGESYRYLEYSLHFLPALAVGTMLFSYEPYVLPFLIFLIFSIMIVAGRNALQWLQSRGGSPQEDPLAEFIEKCGIPAGSVIFPVSMRLGADIVARRPDCRSYWWQPGIISEGIYEDYVQEYPFLKKDWRKIARRDAVSHILVDKWAALSLKWEYDFSHEEELLEDDRYIAYRVRSVI